MNQIYNIYQMLNNISNNSLLVIDCQYFGTINYSKILFRHSNIKIEACESYQKMSFRNRCMVAGSNGVVNLSVPLEKGRSQKELMKDVRISHSSNWQAQHWRTIESCYSRAPFFEFYRDGVRSLFEKKEVFLLDLNLKILEWLKKALKSTSAVSVTETYQKLYPESVTDLRNNILPKNYLEGYDDDKYVQVFEDRIGFQPNLCVLDKLFCGGAGSILSK